MRTDLKSAANGRISSAASAPSASVTACHAAARVNADLIGVAAAGRYSTSPSPTLLDRRAVCEMFGGSKPINPSTLYRGIKLKRYPTPIKVGGSSRWLRTECEEPSRQWLTGGPDDRLRRPKSL
jgi:predicted DNA-binding transcriptional regulator AlpA